MAFHDSKASGRLGAARWAVALLAGLALTLPLSAPQADMAAGKEAFRAGDLSVAFQHFLQEAEAGNTEAQYLAGQMLSNGQGVQRDIPNALDWLEQAAGTGHVGAQMTAGTIYAFGDGIPADYERALLLLTPAAEAGDALAQNNLAVLTFYGLGTSADPVQALAWAIRAERQGLVQAVAFRQEIEKSIPPDQKQAALDLAAQPLRSQAGTQTAEAAPAGPTLPAEPPAAPQPQPPVQTRIPSSVQGEALPPMADAPEPEEAGPAPEPAQPAPSPADTDTGEEPWAVQIAALPSAEEAKRQWAAISRRQAGLLEGQPMEVALADLGERGMFHRILVGRFADAATAQQFCDRLKSAGQDCLIRKR